MKIINQKIIIKQEELDKQKLLTLEEGARTCYKSEKNIKVLPNEKFLAGLVESGHESVLEHEKVTVRLITNRGVTHQLVRHRLASYSQESTRYCNYTLEKFNNELTYIVPFFNVSKDKQKPLLDIWYQSCQDSERHYKQLLANGAKPEEARDALNHAIKTEIVVTMNLRAWRHFIQTRATKHAQPHIRAIAYQLYLIFMEYYAPIFQDIEVYLGNIELPEVEIIPKKELICPLMKTQSQGFYSIGQAIDGIMADPQAKFQEINSSGILFYGEKEELVLFELNGILEVFTIDFFSDRQAQFKKIQ